jgi:hypothetical protein
MDIDPRVIQGAKEVCKIIQSALDNGDGALIGRNGTIELEQMISFQPEKSSILLNNAGIFPSTVCETWRQQSIVATQEADVLATGWYEPLKAAEEIALFRWNCNAIQVPLRSLEPYYVPKESRWTKLLSGHSVSVVSSFTKTMQSQVQQISAIWPVSVMLPSEVNWNWVQTGHPPHVAQGFNEWPPHITNSMEAVDWVVSEVVRQGSRFALIGCGGIGMCIAKRLKERGVICIVLGGAIQVLFGIKGRRWASHSIISKFWNERWVSPSEDETPGNARKVEGGCYW